MTVTIKEIAKSAGVSASTVSCALRDTGRISLKTREQVKSVARELGYRVNCSARATRSARFNCLSLIACDGVGVFRMSRGIIGGMHEHLNPRSHHIAVSAAQADDLPQKVIEQSLVDG
ncbi:MAG: LacI family DNA-binding transcriptional regulator [Planctomycetota bacterium]